MGAIEAEPVLTRAKITAIPQVPCKHKSFIYQLVDPVPGTPTCEVYETCVKNELHSLMFRHLISNGTPSRTTAAELLSVLDQQFPQAAAIEPLRRSQVPPLKSHGPQRARYQRACDSLESVGQRCNWDRVSAFVKVEKWERSQIDKRKPPRLIQFRTYPYCLEISRYLIPIERIMWKYRMNGLPVFAKGMNSFQVADLVVQASRLFRNPCFILADHSKFDASLSVELIEEVEIAFYKRFSSDPIFLEALSKQLNNRCMTKHGIRYTCIGRKMSGEYNTSCGDSIVNLAIMLHAFSGRRVHPIINGDDSIIVVDWDPSMSVPDFTKYGMKTESEMVMDLESVEFCQSRPVEIREGEWRMVRNPVRALSRGVTSVKRYHGIAWAKLVNAIGASEMACNDGVPVMQEFARYMLRSGGKLTKAILEGEISRRARLERTLSPTPKAIQPCARLSFAKAFGIEPVVQVQLEQMLAAHTSEIHPLSKRAAP